MNITFKDTLTHGHRIYTVFVSEILTKLNFLNTDYRSVWYRLLVALILQHKSPQKNNLFILNFYQTKFVTFNINKKKLWISSLFSYYLVKGTRTICSTTIPQNNSQRTKSKLNADNATKVYFQQQYISHFQCICMHCANVHWMCVPVCVCVWMCNVIENLFFSSSTHFMCWNSAYFFLIWLINNNICTSERVNWTVNGKTKQTKEKKKKERREHKKKNVRSSFKYTYVFFFYTLYPWCVYICMYILIGRMHGYV